MIVRMLKDWSWHKAGDVVNVFEPTAKNWVANGIAEPANDPRESTAERAVAPETAESAMVTTKKVQPKKQQ